MPFFCGVCGKQFASATAKRQHKKALHEQQWFQCNVCRACFTSQAGAKAHEKHKHGLYECHVCFRRFKTNTGRTAHENASHNMKLYKLGYEIEKLRIDYPHSIKRPSAVGMADSHGHIWYCFACETIVNYHRSFDTHQAMYNHLKSNHSEWID
eukprot:122397_1